MTNTCLDIRFFSTTVTSAELDEALDEMTDGTFEVVAWAINDHKLGCVVTGRPDHLTEWMRRSGYESHTILASLGEDHPVCEEDALAMYRDFLDELGSVRIGEREYSASFVLSKVDPIAFRVGFNDFCAAEDIHIG